ncbi:Fatty acyl-CoA hydrolase precursor, medium chain [Holothuria leucospilota]|uniref:Fatty acyl-CoA hydrolase, medium chain n=1 Tax=Holothuria leucospilota TaxID=206669 RepID=A0A9Q1CK02_HOLLE|nr:Fatty acyl-CoA hydrolase precursor, medium chain [Holothuria leucospilota]
MALTHFYQIICLVSIFSLFVKNVCGKEFSMDVTTVYGNVRGLRRENYDAFLGIPFAQPPVGELRWKDPRPPPAWSPETFQADTQPPGCIQICEDPAFACPVETSEDCLYLNIYRPSTTQTDGLLPVFIFLHGGNFHSGACSALLYDGRFLVQVADAVVVVPNYRVGKLA